MRLMGCQLCSGKHRTKYDWGQTACGETDLNQDGRHRSPDAFGSLQKCQARVLGPMVVELSMAPVVQSNAEEHFVDFAMPCPPCWTSRVSWTMPSFVCRQISWK